MTTHEWLPLALWLFAAGAALAQTDTLIALYWRLITPVVMALGVTAIHTHNDQLFALTVRSWVAFSAGVVAGLLALILFRNGGWGRGDDEAPEPGPDDPGGRELDAPVRTESIDAGDLSLWDEFESTPAFDPSKHEDVPADVRATLPTLPTRPTRHRRLR